MDYGADSSNKYFTYLMRTEVDAADVGEGVVIEFTFDDAMAVWVNGVYVMSWNMIFPIETTSGAVDTVAVNRYRCFTVWESH